MARTVLTDRGIKALKAAAQGKRYEVMDAIVPGMGVRVTERAQKTFILVARFGGARNPTRRALGEYGALTLEQARGKARGWLEAIQKGQDPARLEERARIEALRSQKNTFAAVAEEFIARHVARTRKARETEREIRKELIPRWGKLPITEITRHDVVAMVDEIVDRGARYQAHNVLGHARKLFNWAIGRGAYGLEASPCDRLRPADVIGRKAVRTRILTDQELRALWSATDRLGYPYGPILRLLLLTGQRKSEVAEAVWPEFDLEKALWTIPPARMKMDAPHVVPLSAGAVGLLASLPRFDGDAVFSTTGGKKPVNGLSKAKTRTHAAMLAELRQIGVGDERGMTLPEWRIHDIRRTVRTHLSALPVADLVRELVIAHAKPGLHKVYDQFAYLDEKRHALELWARRLMGLVGECKVVVSPCSFEGPKRGPTYSTHGLGR
jgi:integrase